ncbi:hypothetical protein [uncultured Tateyamaria sp.]|uniref:hypothetical protein n=1 Tax=uncultured Tateyamaria sp. TaxID=455651 RepID=UPI00261513D5|nr:hypothetical protein [uncultured Tateyamaria sp.]
MQRTVLAAPSWLLRNPNHESSLARYWKSQGLSAATTADQIIWEPYVWHVTGNVVMTHAREELDMERIDVSNDPLTYSMDGDLLYVEQIRDRSGRIDKEKSVPLLNTMAAFGVDRRRTMNRFFAKANDPSENRVNVQVLSMLFWASVAMHVQTADTPPGDRR